MKMLKFIFPAYILTIIALFLYSFTQVDLSLTLSKISVYQVFEKQFQYVGFFQRPLSAGIFSFIVVLLFLFYFLFLYLAKKELLKTKQIKIIIFLTFLLLVLSYNAFSYDLFNYIFDAKILTFYHLNPYMHKAMDFANDPMLNFMRWTHRTYPYGPFWLALTVPLSFIGANYFLLTFFLFKIMIGLSFLGCSFLIYKISEIIFPKEKIFNTVFWSFNPLVIIEGLVSAHNDFPMIFLGLLSIYFYLKKKRVYSLFSYIFSIGIKYSTAVFLPVWAAVIYFEKTKKLINWEKVFIASFLLAIVAVAVASFRTTFQPWYLIIALSMAGFVSKKYYILIPTITASFFCMLIYITYVYMTDYSKFYPQTVLNIEWVGLFASIILTLIYFFKIKVFVKR